MPKACVLFVDANVLLDHPELSRWRCDAADVSIVVLARVEQELQGLGRRPDDTGTRARRAHLALQALRVRGKAPPARPGAPAFTFRRGQDVAAQVDAHLVAEASAYARAHPDRAVAVVSRDQGVWDQAARAGVYCVLSRGAFDNGSLGRAIREARAANP